MKCIGTCRLLSGLAMALALGLGSTNVLAVKRPNAPPTISQAASALSSLYADCDTDACGDHQSGKDTGDDKGASMQDQGIAHRSYADCETDACNHQDGQDSGSDNGKGA